MTKYLLFEVAVRLRPLCLVLACLPRRRGQDGAFGNFIGDLMGEPLCAPEFQRSWSRPCVCLLCEHVCLLCNNTDMAKQITVASSTLTVSSRTCGIKRAGPGEHAAPARPSLGFGRRRRAADNLIKGKYEQHSFQLELLFFPLPRQRELITQHSLAVSDQLCS